MGISCKGTSEKYLLFLNGLLVALSLVVIGYAIYQLVEFDDLRAGISEYGILGPLVVGVALLFVAAIGAYGAKSKKKFFLIVYLILAFIITILVLAAGGILLTYGGYLDDVQDGQVSGTIEKNIVDFELAVYTVCCVIPFGATPADGCVDPPVPPCISDVANFAKFVDKISADSCDVLAEIKLNDVPIVGNATGSCGGGNPAGFVNNISDYLKDNIVTLGSVNLAVAVLMLLIIIASCVLLFTGKDKKKQEKKDVGGPIHHG